VAGAGAEYRLRRAQHTFAINALASVIEPENIGLTTGATWQSWSKRIR
jgi:hypothetical protein